MSQPDVSVVVISYNDAERLPAAVRSVTSQTLRSLEIVIVDDASTDSTPEVAAALCAEDARVRYVRLPVNSGGCSAPRNAGIAATTAPWVMFLDSDDTYERHACKNLLLAVERNGAELGLGRCVRINTQSGKRSEWYWHLFRERATYEDILEQPELLWDTATVNKIYARAFLDREQLRFAPDLHYEDLLFTTQAYCQARRITVIPNLVYNWMVVPQPQRPTGEQRFSISNRRHELANLEHRLRINRLIDGFLDEHERSDRRELRARKDLKFLRHDLRLYLNDLTAHETAYRLAFLDLVAPYLQGIPATSYAECSAIENIVYYLIRRRDLEGVLTAVDYLQNDGKLTTTLHEHDGRVYWNGRHLDDEEGRRVLDVTDRGFHRTPFSQRKLYHRAELVSHRRSTLRVEGTTRNQFGEIAATDDLRLSLSLRRRGTRQHAAVPVTAMSVGDESLRWTAEMDLDERVPFPRKRTQTWDLEVRTQWQGKENISPVSVAPVEPWLLPVHPPLHVLVGDALEAYRTARGNIAFKLVQSSPARRRVGDLAARAVKRKGVRKRLEKVKRLRAGTAQKKWAYRNVFTKLPLRQGLIVFESQIGKQYSDSPRAVYEALLAAGLPHQAVWSYASNPAGFPSTARLVKRESWGYYRALARAEYWVDNQGFPRQFFKRDGTTYLQTWHGTPLKTLGYDEPRIRALGPEGTQEFQAMIDRWDQLVVANEYFERVFVPGHRYTGGLLRTGLPRNDVLFTKRSPEAIAEIKRRLDLPPDRMIVLYAPTFREQDRGRRGPVRLALELSPLDVELSSEIYLLVRPHYLNWLQIPGRFAHFVRDASDVQDVSELYLVADVLITDYSSVMFDYANLERPMIFLAYDYEEYANDRRGTYFNLLDRAPGPVVRTTDEVVEALRDIDGITKAYAEKLGRFRAEFCSYERGHASEDVVRVVFAGLERKARS